jgi:hypothetical protein
MSLALCSRGREEQRESCHLGSEIFDPLHYFVHHCSYGRECFSSHGSLELILIYHRVY